MAHQHEALARNLAAAAIAYAFGYDSIDLVLKQHMPAELHPFWYSLAETVWQHITSAGPNWRE